MFSPSDKLKLAFLSELQKNSATEKLKQKEEEQNILCSWLDFEKKIKNSPHLRSKFSKLQDELLSSTERQKQFPSELVSGILALNLQESEVVK